MQQTRPPVTNRRIRFALIGCGHIAQNHIEAIKKHAERAELVAVCDTDSAVLRAAVEKTGARGYSSLTELLAAKGDQIGRAHV